MLGAEANQHDLPGTHPGLDECGLTFDVERFALGVLWHPERTDSSALFRALVDEARRYRREQLT